MTLTRVQIHDLLYLVRANSFVPGMTKERQEALELSLTEELRNLDNPESFLGTTNFQNFEDLKTQNKHLATTLEKLKPDGDWKDMPIYIHHSLESFGYYLIEQNPYPSLSYGIDWKGFPDPLDHINHETLAKDFLETFADGSDYLWDKTNDIVFEFQQ